MDTTADLIPDGARPVRTSARAGSLTLTVWPDEPMGAHRRYAYRVHDAATGQAVEGRDLFTGAGAPVAPGRAIRELAAFLAASGRARQHELEDPGARPENAGLFPEGVAEAARANLDALNLLDEDGPEAGPPPAERADTKSRRWVSVVFLQGQEADEALDLLEADGTDAAIGRLAGYDYGDETTQAALENGYVYDTPPAGVLDRTATGSDGAYTLVYNPFIGYLNLLREYDAPTGPAQPGPGVPRGQHSAARRAAALTPHECAAHWPSSPSHPTSAAGRGLSL